MNFDESILRIILRIKTGCLQHLHLLTLHLEIIGYIPLLLNGLVYLRRIGDFIGNSKVLIKHISITCSIEIKRSIRKQV